MGKTELHLYNDSKKTLYQQKSDMLLRKMQNDDIEQVMQIWLKTNIQTHHYIDESYWKVQYGSVRQMIPESEIYVCEKSELITGFIGLSGNYIAGLFVASFPVARHREKTAERLC